MKVAIWSPPDRIVRAEVGVRRRVASQSDPGCAQPVDRILEHVAPSSPKRSVVEAGRSKARVRNAAISPRVIVRSGQNLELSGGLQPWVMPAAATWSIASSNVDAAIVVEMVFGESKIGEPIMDTFGVMPYEMMDMISMDPLDPLGAYGHSEMLRDLSPETKRRS